MPPEQARHRLTHPFDIDRTDQLEDLLPHVRVDAAVGQRGVEQQAFLQR